MSKNITLAYMKARRSVLLSLIGDRIGNDLPYEIELKELHKLDDDIAAFVL
jgi:hypothetical protein